MADRTAIARLQGASAAQRQEEEQRQVQAIAEAIQAAIDDASKKFDVPLLNAVAGAIVTVEAHMLAATAPAHRKMLRKSMEKARPGALATALSHNPKLAPTVTVRRHDA